MKRMISGAVTARIAAEIQLNWTTQTSTASGTIAASTIWGRYRAK